MAGWIECSTWLGRSIESNVGRLNQSGLTLNSFNPQIHRRRQHDYLARILNARVYEVAIESPLQPAPYMSRAIKNTVLLKVCPKSPFNPMDRRAPFPLAYTTTPRTTPYINQQREDLQPVFSFKLRGAYNKIVSTPAADLERGVVACSAGNHAQVRR